MSYTFGVSSNEYTPLVSGFVESITTEFNKSSIFTSCTLPVPPLIATVPCIQPGRIGCSSKSISDVVCPAITSTLTTVES